MATMAIMIGIQASGKSSFCKSILKEYVRINLDELNTGNKERIAIMEAIQSGVDIVIDNTNPTKADRERYISTAKNHEYEVVGYFMQSRLQECIDRNEQREGKACVPRKAIACTSNKLEIPDYSEGFDKLYFVSISENGYKIDGRKNKWLFSERSRRITDIGYRTWSRSWYLGSSKSYGRLR